MCPDTLRPFCLMKFNVPKLIIQGTDDQIVPYTDATGIGALGAMRRRFAA